MAAQERSNLKVDGHGPPTEAALRRRWLNIRRQRRRVRARTRFINLRQKIGGFFDQGSRKLGVVCSSRELNKSRRLAREILPAYHDIFPVRLRSAKFRKSGFSFRPSRIKMELRKKFDGQRLQMFLCR
jgi:hypothetical protein